MPLRPQAFLCLALLLGLAACGPKKHENAQGRESAAEAPSAPLDAAAKASLAELPAPYNSGDPVNGERIFVRCRTCHTLDKGAPDLTGPNLWGLFGRKAGSKPDYTYSDPMKGAGFVWDALHLDKWLERPAAYIPGTKMTFIGLPNAQDRLDVIAYLKLSTGPKSKPK
jgi:cytochrome c